MGRVIPHSPTAAQAHQLRKTPRKGQQSGVICVANMTISMPDRKYGNFELHFTEFLRHCQVQLQISGIYIQNNGVYGEDRVE